MWWRRRRGAAEPRAERHVSAASTPVVLAVTEPLTGAMAERLSGQVARLDAQTPIVIDLTGIPSFDSEGAASLAGLQERLGADHVTIVGLRQAAARLTGAAPAGSETTSDQGWIVRRLRNLAVVQVADGATASADRLDEPLT